MTKHEITPGQFQQRLQNLDLEWSTGPVRAKQNGRIVCPLIAVATSITGQVFPLSTPSLAGDALVMERRLANRIIQQSDRGARSQ